MHAVEPNPSSSLTLDLSTDLPDFDAYANETHPPRDHHDPLDPPDQPFTRRDLIPILTTLDQHSANFKQLTAQKVEIFNQLNYLSEQFDMFFSLLPITSTAIVFVLVVPPRLFFDDAKGRDNIRIVYAGIFA